MSADELRAVFSLAVVEAIERLVDERVEAALTRRAASDGDSPWVMLAQAAERLRVSERTITRMVARGRIKTSRVGRRVLVNVADLDEAVAGGSLPTAPPPPLGQPRRSLAEDVPSGLPTASKEENQ